MSRHDPERNGVPAMIRSIFSLLLILSGLPLIAAALNGDGSVITTQAARLHGLYAGIVLVVAGFVLGKFWSLKVDYKGAESAADESLSATQKRQEPVEEQIDLFEPQRKS